LGDLKREFKRKEFDTMEDLQARIEDSLGQLIPETMQRVDEHWIERPQQVIHTNGDYVSGQISS
jgi:hypothetical protein